MQNFIEIVKNYQIWPNMTDDQKKYSHNKYEQKANTWRIYHESRYWSETSFIW